MQQNRNNNDPPFFTVVIPTHNRSNLLKRAVASVLDQTFRLFELIIVDDHSTDGTFSVVRSFSDNRIHYILNRRTKGACGARNTGMQAATGPWVAFLDDDDVWISNKLEFQYELTKNVNATVGLICSDYAIYKKEKSKPVIFKNRPSGWVKDKLLFGGIIGCLSSVCVRTEVLKAIGGFDERFPSCQDQDLFLRVAELSQFAHVPKTLVLMYQEPRNRIGQNAEAKLEGYIMFRNKYFALIDQNLRLRYRYESRIFTYALLQKRKSLAIRCFPWVMLGILVDFRHLLLTLRTTFLLAFRKRAQKRI
jgi:glycosyltransferase involved in cell wall biosynthesis